jgi:hypothetical protein
VVRFLDNFGIEATKGDTIIMPFVVVNNDKSIYQVQSGDIINFGMKKNYSDAECIIEKTINVDTLTLILEHDDTKGLEVGAYYYDIQITKAENNEVNTFMSGIINITNEVYDKD